MHRINSHGKYLLIMLCGSLLGAASASPLRTKIQELTIIVPSPPPMPLRVMGIQESGSSCRIPPDYYCER
jgi:hypothetical protein